MSWPPWYVAFTRLPQDGTFPKRGHCRVTLFDGASGTGNHGGNRLESRRASHGLSRHFAEDPMTEPEPASANEHAPAASTVAFAAALSLKFPQLQSLLSARPQHRDGDLLPYLLLAACYQWLTEHAAKVDAGDTEAQAVQELCGELFAMVFEHDALGAAFAVEMVETLLAESETAR
jgi:hypothetical protein